MSALRQRNWAFVPLTVSIACDLPSVFGALGDKNCAAALIVQGPALDKVAGVGH